MSALSFELGTPKLIEKAYGEKYGLCRIPGIIITQNNSLLCYYEAREDFRDMAKIDIKVKRSDDLGESFHDVLCIEGNGDTLNNPVMISDREIIHFLFCKNYKELFYSRSTDDGKSFSDPINISHILLEDDIPCVIIATGPGHGIVHLDKIIVPVWFKSMPETAENDPPSSVRTLYSEDRGNTWKLGEVIDDGPLISPNESAIAVTSDGDVLISIRSQTKNMQKIRRALSMSHDGISAWSVPKFCEELPDPRCMAGMTHDGEAIYHINCAKDNIREDLTIKVSKDNFDSYESIYVSQYAGYSDIAVNGDEIYVFYERFHEAFHAKWNPKIKTVPDDKDGLYFVKIKIKK